MAVNNSLQQRKPNQTATGYTNIQRILQANKSNPLGSTVAGGVQQAGSQARGAIQQAGNQFRQEEQTEKNRLGQESQRADRVLGDVTKASDEDINAFEGIRGGLSKGPTEIKNLDEIRQKAFEAERLGSAAGSEAGRYGLLQRFVGGNKQYTGGQQRLDSVLLGQTASPQLRQARKASVGLSNQAEQEARAAIESGKVLQGQAKELANTTIGRLGGQVVDYDSAMEQARVAAQEGLKTRQDDLRRQLAANEIEDETLYNRLGVKENDQIFRTNLADYFQARDNIATKQNVQTQADFDRIEALRKLSGQSLTGQASAILPAYTNKEDIDAFKNMESYDISKDALRDKINQELSQYKAADFDNLAHIQLARTGLYGDAEGAELAQRFSGTGKFIYQDGANLTAKIERLQKGILTPEEKEAAKQISYKGYDGSSAAGQTTYAQGLLQSAINTKRIWDEELPKREAMSKAVKDSYQFNRTLQRKKPNA